MRIWDPDKGEHSLNLLERVRGVFVSKLSGGRALANDEVAQTWWKLKFEAEDTLNHSTRLKKGDPLLLVLHQTGYVNSSGNIMTDLRRRLDFGHSALGVRFVGEGPEKDLLLNPGSKNRQFYEVSLPNSENPEVPNMVDMDNLWKWSQTQLGKRYMRVSAEALPLTKTQKEAISVLVPKMRGLNLGPAIATTNNCADGASALVNFLMPIERTFSPKSLVGFSLPTKVSGRARDRFQGAETFKFPDISDKNPEKKTPGTSYKDQSFTRRELTSFDDYLAFERAQLLRTK